MGLGFGLGFVRERLDAAQLDEVVDEADLALAQHHLGRGSVKVRGRVRGYGQGQG